MRIRCAPASGTDLCAGGSPTGAVLTYDNERRLVTWASAPSNPGATAGYAYDSEGHRVAQQMTAGGSTTTTYYMAGLEEQANTGGGSSTLTKYYSVPGAISVVNVGGTLSRTEHEAARVALRPGVL